MAAIDKTYIGDWETFDKIRNWAKDKHFTLKNGKEVYLKNYMYYPDLTKEGWNEQKKNCEKQNPKWKFEIVLWKTPTYVDIWLIRNCPFEEVQERLKEQYDGGGWSKTAFTDYNDENLYEQIKNGTSIYDTYQRNGLGKNAKIIFKYIHGNWFRDKKSFWWITINQPMHWWYNNDDDMWYRDEELMPIDSNYAHRRGTLTKKNIVNLVKKWNLPKDTIVSFEVTYSTKIGRFSMHKFNVIVK